MASVTGQNQAAMADPTPAAAVADGRETGRDGGSATPIRPTADMTAQR
jgi:hypothetical protein